MDHLFSFLNFTPIFTLSHWSWTRSAAGDPETPSHHFKPMKNICAIICGWMGRLYLSRLGLVHPNPGPVSCDFTKLSGCRILSQNVNKIPGKLDRIHDLLDPFTCKCILAFCESGLTKDTPDRLLKHRHYDFVRVDNATRKSLGILIYFTKDIKIMSQKVFSTTDFTLVHVEFALKGERLHFGSIYRLPDATRNFFTDFSNALEELVHSDRKIIIAGDVNVDLMKKGQLQTEYLEILSDFDLSQAITRPTRVRENSSTLIDHLICSPAAKIDHVVNCDNLISDHFVIGCHVLNFGNNIAPPIKYQKCHLHAPGLGINFNKCDLVKLESGLLNMNWDTLTGDLGATSVKHKARFFRESLQSALLESTPKYPCKCGRICPPKAKNFQPWFTEELDLYRLAVKDLHRYILQNPKTKPFLFPIYQCLRNDFTATKEMARENHFKGIVASAPRNKRWQPINEIRGKEMTEGSVIDKLSTPTGEVTSKPEIANGLNAYFATIGKNTCEEVKAQARDSNIELFQFTRNSPENSFHFDLPNTTEVEKATLHFADNKPPGPTGIPPKIMKFMLPLILAPMTALFQSCVLQSTVPIDFKNAHVTAIHKKGPKDAPGNYRPISVTGIDGKIFELVLKWQIEGHLHRYSILSTTQYGFRRGMSTVHAMIDGFDFAIKHLNTKQDRFASLLYLDLSKAFDCLEIRALMKALDAIGFDPPSRTLIFSLLTDRKQVVKLDTVLSDELSAACGVTQGSILGPLLFAIFVNNCGSVLANHFTKVVQYADDVSLITVADTYEQLLERTESNALAAKRYFTSLALKLNLDKTQLVPLTNSPTQRPILRSMVLFPNDPENTIKSSSTAVNLGVIVDDEFSFNGHKRKILGSMKGALGAIRAIRSKISLETAGMLYESTFLGIHDYAAAVFDTDTRGSTAANNDLETLHRRMLRCVFNFLPKRVSNSELYRVSGANLLSNRRKLYVANMAFSCLNGLAPPNVANLLSITNNTARGLNEKRLNVPQISRSNLMKNSFSARAPKLWNQLDVSVRTETSRTVFKKKMKSWLVETEAAGSI